MKLPGPGTFVLIDPKALQKVSLQPHPEDTTMQAANNQLTTDENIEALGTADALSDAPEGIDAAGSPDAGQPEPAATGVESIVGETVESLSARKQSEYAALLAGGVAEDEAYEKVYGDAPAKIPAIEQCDACAASGPGAACSECPKPSRDPELEIPAAIGIDPLDDDIHTDGDPEDDDAPVSAATVAAHFEQAPAHVTLPESVLPAGTEIVKEKEGVYTFKLPGQPWRTGKGRTIGGAMLNAGLLIS